MNQPTENQNTKQFNHQPKIQPTLTPINNKPNTVTYAWKKQTNQKTTSNKPVNTNNNASIHPKPTAKTQIPSRIPQQNIQTSIKQLQQTKTQNAPTNTNNTIQAHPTTQLDSTIKAILTTINALQKENAQIKAKLAETPKSQK